MERALPGPQNHPAMLDDIRGAQHQRPDRPHIGAGQPPAQLFQHAGLREIHAIVHKARLILAGIAAQ